MPAPKVLTAITSGVPELDRVQDHFRAVINPLLKDMRKGTAVTGSKGGNAALASLISALAQIGLITDKTT